MLSAVNVSAVNADAEVVRSGNPIVYADAMAAQLATAVAEVAGLEEQGRGVVWDVIHGTLTSSFLCVAEAERVQVARFMRLVAGMENDAAGTVLCDVADQIMPRQRIGQ